MDMLLITVLPVLLLALLFAFAAWMRVDRSPEAASMAERFGVRQRDEMEKEIEQKSLKAAYYAMLCVLGAYLLYVAWVRQEGIANIAFAAILAAALVKAAVTLLLRWRSTRGDEEYRPYPLWKTLLLLAAVVLIGVAAVFLLLLAVLAAW